MKHFVLLLFVTASAYAQEPILNDQPKDLKDQSALIIDNQTSDDKIKPSINIKSARKNSASARRPRHTSAYVRKRDR